MITPFTADQRRLLVDAGHHYDQYLAIEQELAESPAWMSWRTVNDTQYLRMADSKGHRKSLGARTPETEKIFADFETNNKALKSKKKEINRVLNERAAQMKALRMGKIPLAFSRIVRAYDVKRILGNYLWIGGTHAVLAYEYLAGHWLNPELAATEDLDLVWRDSQHEILAIEPPNNLLGTLKDIDSSYTVNAENRFQVRNSKGMVIDFITSKTAEANTPKEYLKPIGIKGQEWLMLAPAVSSIVIDSNGLPLRIFAPHPGLFALHKLWVSKQPDRNPLKVEKDIAQANAVIELIYRALPQYRFNEELLKLLPQELINIYDSLDLPNASIDDLAPM